MTIAHLHLQISRYKSVWIWFVKDVYFRFLGLTAKIMLYMIGSMVMLVMSLGSIYFYIDGLEKGGEIYVFSASYQYQTSIEILLMVILLTGMMFSASAVLRYMSGIAALNLGRRYEEYCTVRAAVNLGMARKSENNQSWENEAGKLMRSAPRFCGRVARLSIMAVLPSMTFVVTFVVLAYLDYHVTAIVFLIIALSIPFLYAVNVRGARFSRELELTIPAASKVRRDMLDYCSERKNIVVSESDLMRDYVDKGPLHTSLSAYIGRLRTVADGTFITQVMLGVGIVVIIWIMGREIIQTGSGWSALATYLIALRINLASFSSVGVKVTGINRFYPQIMRYYSFVTRDRKGLIDQDHVDEGIGMQEANGNPDIDLEELIKERPSYDLNEFLNDKHKRVSMLIPEGAPDDFIKDIIADVFSCTSRDGIHIVKSIANIKHSSEYSREDADVHSNEISGNDSPKFLSESINAGADPNVVNHVCFVESVCSAITNDYPYIVIEMFDWLGLTRNNRKYLNERLKETTVVLLVRDGNLAESKHRAKFIIVTDGDSLLVQCGIDSYGKMEKIINAIGYRSVIDSGVDHDDE
jgi:ABC-type multidrug transport system fused ATPase/permease subunit